MLPYIIPSAPTMCNMIKLLTAIMCVCVRVYNMLHLCGLAIRSATIPYDTAHHVVQHCVHSSIFPTLDYKMHTAQGLESDGIRGRLIKRTTLCNSLAGNPVDLLTITAPTDNENLLKKRKGVVISGVFVCV